MYLECLIYKHAVFHICNRKLLKFLLEIERLLMIRKKLNFPQQFIYFQNKCFPCLDNIADICRAVILRWTIITDDKFDGPAVDRYYPEVGIRG